MATTPFALAGDALEDLDISPLKPANTNSDFSEGWEFEFTPYIWGASIEGEIGVKGLSTPIDWGFDDILENLDGAFMFAFDARKDRFGIYTEGFWMKLSDRSGSSEPDFRDVKVTVSDLIFDAMIYYRVVEEPYTLDLLAGGRYFYLDTELDFKSGILGGRQVSGSQDFIDPVVGFRLHYPFSEKFTGVLFGDIGGFDVSSKLTWQVFAGLHYKLTECVDLKVEWRHMEIDYDRGGFKTDLELNGLMLGAGITF